MRCSIYPEMFPDPPGIFLHMFPASHGPYSENPKIFEKSKHHTILENHPLYVSLVCLKGSHGWPIKEGRRGMSRSRPVFSAYYDELGLPDVANCWCGLLANLPKWKKLRWSEISRNSQKNRSQNEVLYISRNVPRPAGYIFAHVPSLPRTI